MHDQHSLTAEDLKALAARLRIRAAREQPTGRGEEDDFQWAEGTAVARACAAVAEELEGFLKEIVDESTR